MTAPIPILVKKKSYQLKKLNKHKAYMHFGKFILKIKYYKIKDY